MENHATNFENKNCLDMKKSEVPCENKKNPDRRIPSNASSSSSDMEVQISDMEVCQAYANSSSSGFSEMQSSSSESGKSKNGTYDEENNCIPLVNGSVILSLMEAKMWHKFVELGTEMIINRTGRRMFPYVEFFLKGVDPVGLYDVMFDIIPASSKSFKFLNNKWIPIGQKDEEFKNHPFKHPDSPRIGSDWMTRKISFEKIKLSNKPDEKDGIFTLHTFQKYLVCISIVKHERDDELSVTEFPIRATTFIAVTAYNNREVTKLKINSNPYSKGFRFPVKRSKTHTIEELDKREGGIVTYDDCVKNTLYCHPEEIPISIQSKTHTIKELDKREGGIVTYDDCVKNTLYCHPEEIPISIQSKTHTIEDRDKREGGIVTYDDCVKNTLYCHPEEIPISLQGPLDLSIKNANRRTKGEYVNDKETQTNITMADIKTWYSFLGYPHIESSADVAMSVYHMLPYFTRRLHEEDVRSDGQMMTFPEELPEFKSPNQHATAAATVVNEGNSLQRKERDREMRKERQKEYNARIEMWKRDNEGFYPDNPRQMKN